MLDKHLIAKTRPIANEKNVVLWKNYRVTVLGERLFRMEYSEKRAFRDEATLSVFYRDMPPVSFQVEEKRGACEIVTAACRLIRSRWPFRDAARRAPENRPFVSCRRNCS